PGSSIGPPAAGLPVVSRDAMPHEKTAPRKAPFGLQRDVMRYFFGASGALLDDSAVAAGAGVEAAVAPAAGALAPPAAAMSIFCVLPAFTIATGSTLPPCSWKMVISASLRSPLSSNSMCPVAP